MPTDFTASSRQGDSLRRSERLTRSHSVAEAPDPLTHDAFKRLSMALDRHGVAFVRTAAIRRPVSHSHHGRDSGSEDREQEWRMAAPRHVDAARRGDRGLALASASGVWMARDALPTGITVEQLRHSLGSERFTAQTGDFDLSGRPECRLIFFASFEAATTADIQSWRRVAGRPTRAALAVGVAVLAALGAGLFLLRGTSGGLPAGREIEHSALAAGAALIGVAMAAGWMLAGLWAQARALDAPQIEAETEMDATRETPTGGGEPIFAAEAAARRAVARAIKALAAGGPSAPNQA